MQDVLLYANKNFLTSKPIQAGDDAVVFTLGNKNYTAKDLRGLAEVSGQITEENIAVLTDPNCPVAFSRGVLASMIYGKYSVFLSGTKDFLKVLKYLPNTAVLHDSKVDRNVLDQISSLGHSKFITTST